MSTHDEPGPAAAEAAATPMLRRRVVFELTADQLPLLEQAERRHGSKRAALLAALTAETRLGELEARAAAAERELAKRAATSKRNGARSDQRAADAERELKATRKQIERLAAELDQARDEHERLRDGAYRDEADWAEAVAERDEEITELAERAVDKLYCARCKRWAAPPEWTWRPTDDGGEYAYHDGCGDHGPGLLDAATWLAYRRP